MLCGIDYLSFGTSEIYKFN